MSDPVNPRWVALRVSEIVLLRRALAMYAKEYEKMRSMTSIAWEKEENRRYVQAADRLSERLMRESVAEIPGPIEVAPATSRAAKVARQIARDHHPECSTERRKQK